MPFFSKRYTECDRQRLCVILLGLNIIQIYLSMIFFALGAYISLDINSKAHLIKDYNLKTIGGTLSGCSLVLLTFHIVGAKVSNDCGYVSTRHQFENKLFLIVLGYIVMAAILLSVPVLCMVENARLKKSLRHGLWDSMKLYARDTSKKRDFDEMQMDYRCCGSSNHTDWFRVRWMPENSLPPESNRMFNRKDYLHSVPFTCCDPAFTGPCFHRLVKKARGQYKYPNHGFFKRGCTERLLEVVEETLLATAISILVPIFLELVMAAQTRYLQTSLDDCKRRKDPTGVGVGILIGKCPCNSKSQLKTEARKRIPDEKSILYVTERTKNSDESDHILKKSRKKPKSRIIRANDYELYASRVLDSERVKPASMHQNTDEIQLDDDCCVEVVKPIRKKRPMTRIHQNSTPKEIMRAKNKNTVRKFDTRQQIVKDDAIEEAQVPSGNRAKEMEFEVYTSSDNEELNVTKPLLEESLKSVREAHAWDRETEQRGVSPVNGRKKWENWWMQKNLEQQRNKIFQHETSSSERSVEDNKIPG